IALRDLEIRGGGDMLGTRQSGHIAAVGFHLYTQLLAQAVKHQKGQGAAPSLPVATPTVTIDLPVPTYIPTTFIAEPTLRIQLYRRFAELTSPDGVNEIETELVDRFGKLPRAVQGLLFQLRIKLLANVANATAIAHENGQIAIRVPYLATTDRAALQQQLGHNVRVSRVAIWLPYEEVETAEWQASLIEVLSQLQTAHIQAETP
ncbi:MAG: hypothetical protein K8S97_02325, partial [Anaerolineae bacterium]|nr:hypothetical protein [Anaerolineae bacterium]